VHVDDLQRTLFMIVIFRSRRGSKSTPPPDNSPTPEQIGAMTAEIRRSWTHRERCRRANSTDHFELTPLPIQSRRKGFWGD
jgi:hypothetical protein